MVIDKENDVPERLTRYLRRALHFPTTLASLDERVHRIETRVEALSDRSVDHRRAEPVAHDRSGADLVYSHARHPTLTQEHVAGAVLYANRVDALSRVPKNGHIAEIGVAAGDFTEAILNDLCPVRFDAFDIFRLHELSHLWGRSTEEWFEGRTHRSYYESRFERELASGVVEIFEGDSSVAMMGRPDGFYDMIYIDGDHSFEGALRDAEASAPKLKSDGLLVFNDYTMMDHVSRDPYGIVPVVNDFCVNRGWTVAYFALQHDLFCDIALSRSV